jgi:uncharacterized protein
MINRTYYLNEITNEFKVHQVCCLLGPRQCGKTTLALEYQKKYPSKSFLFDLENPEDLEALLNPLRALEDLEGLVIIDEIQHLPDLFPVLRVLADRKKAKYLILGSASRDLIRQSTETLAGRIGYIELTPFSLFEKCDPRTLFMRGGYPKSYLANSEEESVRWRKFYIRTFLERDIPSLGFNIPPAMLQRFWMMLSHYHGQLLNMNQIAKSMSISGPTVRNYLDILVGTFMVRILSPWYENVGKRQIKTPKIYLRDTGLMNTLNRIQSDEDMRTSPLKGAIWEGFALEEIIRALHLDSEDCFFWRTQHGSELDLLTFKNGKRIGFEFKYGDTPKTTKSMHMVLGDLKLDKVYVIYPGSRTIHFSDTIEGRGLSEFISSL